MSFLRNLLTISLVFCFAQHGAAQDQYAVIVGVESYDPGTFNNLKYAAEDANSLGDVLKDYGYRITLLTSQSTSAKLQPFNAKNIRTAIRVSR